MTFIQRRLNDVASTLRRRCIDVMCLLGYDTVNDRQLTVLMFTLSILSEKFSREHFEIVFSFSSEKRF